MPPRHVSICEPLCFGLFVVLILGWGSCVCVEETLSPLSSVEQEELAILRRELEGKDGEMRSADPTERGEKESQSQSSLKVIMPHI